MSIARHHAEWLSLIETSGPFLSMPVLLRVFPQGLDQRDPAKASRLREAYEDWLERGAKQPAVHHAWIRHVLTELLEYPPEFLVEGQAIPPGMEAVMANYGETLRPDFALLSNVAADVRRLTSSDSQPSTLNPQPGRRPLLLIEHYAPDQDLEKPVAGKIWKASPGTRMMELLHAADVPLGLVTNGEQWMLVSAPRGETTGFASWYADLWMQEPLTLRAFHSLLHLRRFVGVAEPETLAALYAESSKDQQEVTDQLGYQVRRAVEMLVQAFDRIDAESDRKLLAGVKEKDLYDSALTVMMRLVFLFSADERGLLLLGDPLYDQHYAVSTLSEILRERADQHGEEVLERRHDAWCRLLATFRAVHAGVEHEAMRLPPYGGTLFDPDRYPFLEGRAADTHWQTTPAKPLPINNRVVLHLLEALQVLRVKVSGGGNRAGSGQYETRRLSFRALDIEQIGHVYEGLLDHTAKRATELILGLKGSKDREPEVALSKLEELYQGQSLEKLLEFLKEETGRSEKALGACIGQPAAFDKNPLRIACGQDAPLVDRVSLYARLLREDDFGKPAVFPTGSIYVTQGSDRRSTGTHYTPRSLTEPIVQHTLEPLVYTGPAEGTPRAEWRLKSPREILALKVCDMTMGSGAFLVQTCRYLAERLVEAWEKAEQANPGKILATPEGDFSAGDLGERLIPADPAERLAIARRYVADRCLYGVDINPMAVEMAKLSLWLITLQRDRPFTFLDHALKCGDSLLGVSSVQQIENFSLRPGERQVTFATANLFRYVDEASAKRRALEDLPSNDHTQIETKNRLHAEAEAATAKVKAVADCLIAFELRGLDGDAYEDQRADEAEKVQLLMKRDADAGIEITNPKSELANYARKILHGRRAFHWPLEFPEVFAAGGFSFMVGNPPFVSYYSRQSDKSGSDFARQLACCYRFTNSTLATNRLNSAMFFWERATNITSISGNIGLLNDLNLLEENFAVIREHLVKHCSILTVVPNIKAFKQVASGQVFLSAKNRSANENWKYLIAEGWGSPVEMLQSKLSRSNKYDLINPSRQETLKGQTLGELFVVNTGVNLGGASDEFLTNEIANEFSKPYITSKAIQDKLQGRIVPSGYITFSETVCEAVNRAYRARGSKNVAVLGKLARFIGEKIIVRQSASEIIATVDAAGIVCGYNYFVVNKRQDCPYDVYYAAGVLNSTLLTKYAVECGIIKMAEGKQPQIRKAGLDSLPIPTPRDQSLVQRVSDVVKKLLKTNEVKAREELFCVLEKLVADCFSDHSEKTFKSVPASAAKAAAITSDQGNLL